MIWISVDFGTHRIKLLKLYQDGQRLQIEGFHAIESKADYFKGLGFPDTAAWTAVTIALNELDWLRPDEEHVVIAALPSAYLETRYLKFPFKSDKKIEKVLNFELESTIPFDIEEIQIRSQTLEGEGISTSKKESLVLAMAYRRSTIKQLEGELKKFQLSNPSLTVQILALSCLRQAISEPNVFGILEIGHSKSEFVLLSKSGQILGIKTFWWGGKNLVQGIQEEFAIDEEKAMHILTHIDPEKPPTKSMVATTRNLITELRQTLKGMRSAGIDLPKPLVIYSLGKPGQIAPLMEQIQSSLHGEFDLQIKDFPYSQLRSRNLLGWDNISGNLDVCLPALSLALSQSRSHRARVPSFSETGFQFQQNLKKLKTGSFSFLKRVAMLLIFPVLYATMQFVIQNKENQKLLSVLPNILRGSGFEASKGDTTEDIVAQLKKEMAANRSKISQMQEDETSPLVVLTQISKSLPAHLKIDVKEFRVSPSTIVIAAETNSIETANQLIESLKSLYPKLKSGAISNCTTAQKKDCKSFSVEVQREKT